VTFELSLYLLKSVKSVKHVIKITGTQKWWHIIVLTFFKIIIEIWKL